MTTALHTTLDALQPELSELFAAIARESRDGDGVTRDAFGEAETRAGRLLIAFAEREGLEARFDSVGNATFALAEHDGRDPEILVASHIDSVPRGGNYDGLAGVIAGLALLTACRRAAILPRRAVRVIGFRGEESPWFGTAYLGSRLLAGQFKRAELGALRRFDTGRSLAEHMEDLGLAVPAGDPAPAMPLAQVKAYFELHIEQAPLLEAIDCPLGVASAIRGNIRYPFAKCFGAYAHSGAVPRHLRSDALLATAKLLAYADQEWAALVARGNDDLVFTCGICHTDPVEHAMTKVPGETTFSLNIGGTRNAIMDELHARLLERSRILAQEHRVRFDLGPRVGTPAVELDETLRRMVTESAQALGVGLHVMPTVGHDAAIFARMGIPTSVILVRNANGSHNPAEHMDMDDFMKGVAVLAATVTAL